MFNQTSDKIIFRIHEQNIKFTEINIDYLLICVVADSEKLFVYFKKYIYIVNHYSYSLYYVSICHNTNYNLLWWINIK